MTARKSQTRIINVFFFQCHCGYDIHRNEREKKVFLKNRYNIWLLSLELNNCICLKEKLACSFSLANIYYVTSVY